MSLITIVQDIHSLDKSEEVDKVEVKNTLENKPFYNEIQTSNFENLSFEQLSEAINTAIYLGVSDTRKLIDEYLWKMDKTRFLQLFSKLRMQLFCDDRFNETERWYVSENSVIGNEIKRNYPKYHSYMELSVRFVTYNNCDKIAYYGNLRLLKWAREQNIPWGYSVFTNAAINGHLDVLEWLHNNECPRPDDLIHCAAQYNQLEAIKWARSKGYFWDKHVYCCAKDGDHFELIEWLKVNGCPYDPEECDEMCCGI